MSRTLVSKVAGENHITVETNGWMLDIQVRDGGLYVFVYNDAVVPSREGCVAMAYDADIADNGSLRLTGNELP